MSYFTGATVPREATSCHAGEVLQRVKLSPWHLWQKRMKANFPNDEWTLRSCRCLFATKYSEIQLLNCGLLGRPPSITATSSPLHSVSSDLLCLRVISPWQQAHERDMEEETERAGERMGRLTHLLILPCTWKWASERRYSGKGLEFYFFGSYFDYR